MTTKKQKKTNLHSTREAADLRLAGMTTKSNRRVAMRAFAGRTATPGAKETPVLMAAVILMAQLEERFLVASLLGMTTKSNSETMSISGMAMNANSKSMSRTAGSAGRC
jgi:hypothetical protein